MSTNDSSSISQSSQRVPAKRSFSGQTSSDSPPKQKQLKADGFGLPPIHSHQHILKASTSHQLQPSQHYQQTMYQGQQGNSSQGGQQSAQQSQQRQPELTPQQYAQLRIQLVTVLTGQEKDNFVSMINSANNVINEKGQNAPETVQVQNRLNNVTRSLWIKYQRAQHAAAGIQNQGAGRPAATTAGSAPSGQSNQFVPPPNLSPAELQRWKEGMNNRLKQMAQRLQALRGQMAQIQQLIKSPDTNGHDQVKLRAQLENYARQYKQYKEWIDNFKAASLTSAAGAAPAPHQASPVSGTRTMSVTSTSQDGSDANNLNKPAQNVPSITSSQQQPQQQQQQQPPSQQHQPTPNGEQTNNSQQTQAPQSTQQPLQQSQPSQPQQTQPMPQNAQNQSSQPTMASRASSRPPTAGWSSMSPTSTSHTPQQSPMQQLQSPTQMSPQLSQQGRSHQPSANATVQPRSPAPGTPGGPAQPRDTSAPPRPGSAQPMARPPTATQLPSQQQPPSRPQAASAQSPPPPSAFMGQVAQNQQTGSNKERMPVSKSLNQIPLTPVASHSIRPSLSGGMNSAGSHVMGTPALVKNPAFELDEGGMGLLSKRKLEELVRQIDPDEKLDPEVEECVLELVDEFIDTATTYACKMAKLRGSDNLDIKDIQIVLERNWNIRIPGYAADDIRTVRKFIPAQAYMQKMSALAAGKALNQSTAKGEA